jgi:hypothetical protein
MDQNKIKTIAELVGKNVGIKESEKSIKKKEEKQFIDLVTNLCAIEAHSRNIFNSGIDITIYDNMYFQVISLLLDKTYNIIQKNVILWWVFESLSPEGDVYPLMDENEEKHIINTPLQLYKFIKQYDGR